MLERKLVSKAAKVERSLVGRDGGGGKELVASLEVGMHVLVHSCSDGMPS